MNNNNANLIPMWVAAISASVSLILAVYGVFATSKKADTDKERVVFDLAVSILQRPAEEMSQSPGLRIWAWRIVNMRAPAEVQSLMKEPPKVALPPTAVPLTKQN